MKVALGKFAALGIEHHLGVDLVFGVQVALAHYLRGLRSGLAPVDPPWFSRGAERCEPFELPLDAEAEDQLDRLTRRFGLTVDQILTHAVLVYLADLDSILDSSPGSRLSLH